MTCPICLEEITRKNKTVILTCDHKFHRKCLKQWYQTNKLYYDKYTGHCPTCRQISYDELDFQRKPSVLTLVTFSILRLITPK